MNKKLILAIVFMLSLTMVSCGTNKDVANNTTSNSSSSVKQDTNTSNSDKDKDKVTEKEDTKTEPEKETTTQNNSSSASKENSSKVSIYSIDENSLEPNEVKTVSINESSSLNDKLTQLSKTVSQTNFDGLPMEVKSIDTVNGKKVATINLYDSSSKSWVEKFQGSTGGQVTANTLIENFLQSNNQSKGEWIDGVKFLYNGENIEYDHVADLSTIQYRN